MLEDSMKMFDRIDRHTALVHKMSDTVGADLGDALLSGDLSGEALRSAVLRCTSCESADDCERWLEDHAESGSDSPPEYCLNRELFQRLTT
jgi:hypothetical protein